jgi:hypothetical protein
MSGSNASLVTITRKEKVTYKFHAAIVLYYGKGEQLA